MNKELDAPTQITQEFGKEAPKAVGDVSSYMQFAMIDSGNVDAADKWAEGGAYRVALHTLVGAIATGSVDGALASGTTAVSIPAVGRYLDEQGVDETTKGALLLGLSAGVGAVVGGDMASTASSFSQTQNNYLNHIEKAKLNELLAKKERMTGKAGSIRSCNRSTECKAELASLNQQIKKYEDLSNKRDADFNVAYDNCRSGAGCSTFYGLHVNQRQQWNAGASQSLIKDFNAGNLRSEWDELPDEQNIFHNFNTNGDPQKLPNGQYRFKKFVSKDGYREVIIDSGKDGILKPNEIKISNIVTDPTNSGSYNYYSPTDEGIKHKDYDVDPYIDFGSGKGDRTILEDRRDVPTSKKVFGIEIPVGPAEILFGELPRKTITSGRTDKYNKSVDKKVDSAIEKFNSNK